MKPGTLEVLTGASVAPGSTGIPTWLLEELARDEELNRAWRGLKRNTIECDRTVIQRLIKADRSDTDILDALRWRPIRYATPSDDQQLIRQMADLADEVRQERQRAARAVVVEKLVIYDGDPPRYQCTIQGREVTLTSQEMLSPVLFRRRAMELCHVLLDVPRKLSEWDEMVREWLEAAEHREVGVTDESYARGEVEAVIESWARIDASDAHVADLRRGVVVVDTDLAIELVHLTPIRRELRSDGIQIGPQDLAVQMRQIGWSDGVRYVGGAQVRCWSRPLAPYTCEGPDLSP